MKKVLIATHGEFAQGIVSSINIILGKQEHLYYINAYVNETPFKEELKTFFNDNISDDDQLIIFTDIFGGSVNQTTLEYLTNNHIYIVSGVNLPVLLEVIMLNENDVTETKISEIVNNAREQIIFANEQVKSLNTNQEDDFDI